MSTEASAEPGPAASPEAPGTDSTRDTAGGTTESIGDLVRDATTHLSTLVRGEVELAKLELAASARRLGWGTAFFGAAATLLCFSLFFPFIALAEGLVAVGLPRWAAYLVVWFVLLLLAALLGLVGVRVVRRIRRPERTLATVRDTARLARRPGRSTAGRTGPAGDEGGAAHGPDRLPG